MKKLNRGELKFCRDQKKQLDSNARPNEKSFWNYSNPIFIPKRNFRKKKK